MSEEEVQAEPQSENDSENESPEDISFSASKEKALNALKTAENIVKQEKVRLKEIRRKKDKFYKDQKEASKRKLLESSVLDDLPSTGELESPSQTESSPSPTIKHPNKITRFVQDTQEPILITRSTDFHVRSSRDQNKIKTHASKTALDFKRSKLFSSDIRRVSTEDRRRGDQKYMVGHVEATH
ncbi:unnamed protein product [Lepeophtheirus salmonis]|uniref:(salmon louse) hypothetical protein n=1 Tax=Lepeophtheirus salmonis TaxID=72036 RepID=A0A7R8CQU6_LEPSM|nr:unnamed protein product [Lepeophtheirus salmonis]CAF2896673.1 unnamed protein product [Lepeophtheirus salmonis]